MRRPLLAVNMLLVAIAWIRLASGGWDSPPDEENKSVQFDNGTLLYATGQVCQKEEQTIWLQSVTVCLEDNEFLSSGNSEQNIPNKKISYGKKLVCEISQGTEEIPLGSNVIVQGNFAPFSRASNPGEFDASVYYRTLEAGGRLRKARVLARSEQYWYVWEAAYQLRQYLCERLDCVMSPKYAGVMRTLLLGDKAELDGEMKALFQRNGILHILSISSLHITIIGMGVYQLLRRARVPIVPAAIAGSLILLFYGMMTGFSVSAYRAIGMYLIKMGAELLGRSYDMLTALGILATVMVLGNPYYLQNAGFLLSFASVMGIGAFYPVLAGRKNRKNGARFFGERKWRVWLRKLGQSVKESGMISLSVTLATLPIQLWNYYELPVYSLFVNLLIIPLMKPLMAAGFLSLLPMGGIAGKVGEGILWCYEVMCKFFDGLPLHTWTPGRPKAWQVVAYYGILAAIVLWDEKRESRKKEMLWKKRQEARTMNGGRER